MEFARSSRVGIDKIFESHRKTFLTSPLPFYGLDATWTGVRATGDYEYDSDGYVRIGLGHGDPRDISAPQIQLVTATGDFDDLAWTLYAYVDDDPTNTTTPETVDITMTIDGTPITFQLMRGQTGWAGRTTRPGHGLLIEAHNAEPANLQIVTVTDLGPYLAGRRNLLGLTR